MKKVWAEFEVKDELELSDIALALEVRFGGDGDTATVWGEKAHAEQGITGWIRWEGGEQPVADDQKIEVWLRDGSRATEPASYFDWGHPNDPGDIIAYREVLP